MIYNGDEERGAMVEALAGARGAGAFNLIIDVRHVHRFNAAGIGLLIFVRNWWVANGGELCICGPCPRMELLLVLCQLTMRHFKCYACIEDAVVGLLMAA
jgi:anti-anti-sigma regulatory factor